MPKEFLKLVKICNFISKYAIYALAALSPVLFLPITSDAVDFNKQTALIFLVFVSLFAWMVKVLVTGKFFANFNKTHIFVGLFFLATLISTIFSQNKYGSFWGWPQPVSDGFITIIGLVILYFLLSNVLAKNEAINTVIIGAISSGVAILYATLQLLGLFVLPFGFLKSAAFNTIGSVGSLGIFIAVLIPLFTILVMLTEKWLRIIFGVATALCAISLVLINYPIVWWTVLVGSVALIVFGIFKKDLIDLRWLSVSMFFLVLALFFIILRPAIGGASRPIEVYLNQSSTLDISLKVLKQNPILGTGPGTFSADFSKYKKSDFNNSPLWNIRFDKGGSEVLNSLATTGLLGFAAILALMASVIFYGVKFIFLPDARGKKGAEYLIILSGGILASVISLLFAHFIYTTSLGIDILLFVLIGSLVGLISENNERSLAPSSFLTLGVTFVFTLLFIFGLGLLILDGQRYLAQVNYYRGITANTKDKMIANLEKAASINPNVDIYWTDLSQAYLSAVPDIASQKTVSDADKAKISNLINFAVNATNNAIAVNPNNVSNYSIRGFVCQNLIGSTPGAEECAIKAYEQASVLDPYNPYYVTQKGIVLLSKAYGVDKDSESAKKSDLSLAKEQFDKAIKLKSDYASARFQIAMVYSAQGKTEQVMPALQDAKKYAPQDVGLSFQIGLLYYQDKDYKNAQTELERTVSLNPKYSNALYFLGLTYAAQGQKEKAIDAIKKVVDLNPDNSEVKTVLGNLKSGKDPLDGISQENPPQEPVKEQIPEKTKK